MDEPVTGKHITYKYEKHEDYRILFANGAIGGATPRGDIKFDLFIEYAEPPQETVHSITPDGLGPEIRRKPQMGHFLRQSQVGVIMSPGQAKSFAYWLMNQVETLEKRRRPSS